MLGGVEGDEFAQQFFFSLGGVDVEAFFVFDLANEVYHVGALVEQAHEALVNGVDFDADVFEVHGLERMRDEL